MRLKIAEKSWFWVTLLTVLFVVNASIGCSKTDTKLEEEGSQRLATKTASENDIGLKYSIWINPGVEESGKSTTSMAKTWKWKSYDETQRKEIRTQLTEYIRNLQRIFAIASHKDMRLVNGQNIQKCYENAKAFRDSLDAFEHHT